MSPSLYEGKPLLRLDLLFWHETEQMPLCMREGEREREGEKERERERGRKREREREREREGERERRL